MIDLDDAVVARYKKGGGNFEVLVDPEGALSLRMGNDIAMSDILAVESIFEDAPRGNRSSEKELAEAFGTTDVIEIAKRIILEGDVRLTSKQKQRIREEKRRKVIDAIARNAINPQTNTPHPPSRIEKAMDEAGVHVDISKSVDELVKETMKRIRPILPIRFEEVDIAVKIPAEYAAKSYGDLHAYGKIVKEEWQNNGSLIFVIRIPAGLRDDIYASINRITKGAGEIKPLK